MRKVNLVKRADTGADPDIFDAFFGFGQFGNPFLADIVNAGWLPRAFFEAVGGPGGGRGILAFSVTFIFTDADDNPTDINGDNYLDTALNEVYYNDTFGNPNNDRVGNPWGINIVLPGIDVETVALHENGHSLGLGHFGPPPDCRDESGLCGHPARPARHRPGGHENHLVVLAEVDLHRCASCARPAPHRSRTVRSCTVRSASADPGTARSRSADRDRAGSPAARAPTCGRGVRTPRSDRWQARD